MLAAQCGQVSYKLAKGRLKVEGSQKNGSCKRMVILWWKLSWRAGKLLELQLMDVKIETTSKVTDHYDVLEKLGSGKFGAVHRLSHKTTGQVCAGKFYKGRGAKQRAAARKEIELMNFLHHPRLVRCLAAYEYSAEIVMVLEYVAGGELFERIVDENFEHTEVNSAHYMQQILQGLQFMHQQDIVHLDLKPENIVCMDRSGTDIKIIDFGLARKLDPSCPLSVMQGTPEFVAPEVINFEPVSLTTDMWSVGVICYILLSGESPFQGDSDAESLALVTEAQLEFDESFEDISEEAKDFISSLLEKDRRHRLSCEKALQHEWMVAFSSPDTGTTKTLSKHKMKKFLARQKWKKTGKALQALKRMALSSKHEGSEAFNSPSPGKDVQEVKDQHAPVFIQSLSDQTAARGSTAQLTCIITGFPDPEVSWLRGGAVLEEHPSHVKKERRGNGLYTLLIEKLELQDSGEYTCKATNSHGEALCSARLTVSDGDLH
ncbi:myosin light chain kinase, smooth muscle-like [Denticeps clupeoides]|uniref:myosin light chain kinase, smooth muscle-like n=1 Tax=Denticeps clupeoides TaxID=299321 RepID=UPI0010A3698A|nr:myosin light chain kinase, smooth muscle-like [Denticeps clupeoides]